jgi:hypothetical protein
MNAKHHTVSHIFTNTKAVPFIIHKSFEKNEDRKVKSNKNEDYEKIIKRVLKIESNLR